MLLRPILLVLPFNLPCCLKISQWWSGEWTACAGWPCSKLKGGHWETSLLIHTYCLMQSHQIWHSNSRGGKSLLAVDPTPNWNSEAPVPNFIIILRTRRWWHIASSLHWNKSRRKLIMGSTMPIILGTTHQGPKKLGMPPLCPYCSTYVNQIWHGITTREGEGSPWVKFILSPTNGVRPQRINVFTISH